VTPEWDTDETGPPKEDAVQFSSNAIPVGKRENKDKTDKKQEDSATQEAVSSLPCKGCGKVVFSYEKISVLDGWWHPKCFKCSVCQMQLSAVTFHSYDLKPYCQSHVPTLKATSTVDDAHIKHFTTTQKEASIALKSNTSTQKGTGEKPTQHSDDQMLQHARETQKITSESRKENIQIQKGTGEKPNQDI